MPAEVDIDASREAGWLLDAAVDLLLGGRCVGCRRPGRLLCPGCRHGLPRQARLAWPTPTPGGLVAPYAAAPYDGTVRAMVLGLKERRLLGLVRPLGGLLATAVREVTGPDGPPLLLVPVPSSPATVRRRGHDCTRAVTAAAAAALRREGYAADVVPLLRQRAGVADQSGLDATARAANLSGSMTCPSPALRRLAHRSPMARTVVCDDVLTTGSTAREAQRALEAVGLDVAGVAVVAATQRRVVPHG